MKRMGTHMAPIEAILFDLGGVLVDFTGIEAVRRLMRSDPGPAAAKARWGASRAIQDFEHGRIEADAFAEAFVEEWDLAVGPAEFMDAFQIWVSGPRDGVAELLEALRRRRLVACFSNTNAVHWRRMMQDGELRDSLDRAYASFEIGMMKPSAAAFAHVSADMGVPLERVLFFDDGAGNVAGAIAAGLQAELAESVADLRRHLATRGLLRD